MNRLDPILQSMTALQGKLLKSPVTALAVTIGEVPKPSHQLRLTLKNVGNTPVCFADPRALGSTDLVRWAGFYAGETWEMKNRVRLGLVNALAQEKPVPLRLGAGESLTLLSEPWHPKLPGGSYRLQGVVSSYAPLPPEAGCTSLQGAVLSEYLDIPPLDP